MERTADESVPDASGLTAPIILFRGPTVALGPVHRGILPALARWFNDVTASTLAGDTPLPLSAEQIEAEYTRFAQPDSTRVDWLIYEQSALRAIGIGNLRDIDHHHRCAELGIMLGETDCWGKGFGTEATYLLLDYGFNVLGLHNIILDPVAFNERAIRTYRRVGFREIGRRRQAHRIGAVAHDLVLMDYLASEFRSPYPLALPGREPSRNETPVAQEP